MLLLFVCVCVLFQKYKNGNSIISRKLNKLTIINWHTFIALFYREISLQASHYNIVIVYDHDNIKRFEKKYIQVGNYNGLLSILHTPSHAKIQCTGCKNIRYMFTVVKLQCMA